MKFRYTAAGLIGVDESSRSVEKEGGKAGQSENHHPSCAEGDAKEVTERLGVKVYAGM